MSSGVLHQIRNCRASTVQRTVINSVTAPVMITAGAVHISGPETLSGNDRDSACKSEKETENKKGQSSGGTDCRQRPHAEGFPHDHGVSHAVKLLKNISDQKRDGKFDDQIKRFAANHILCHKKPQNPGYRKVSVRRRMEQPSVHNLFFRLNGV